MTTKKKLLLWLKQATCSHDSRHTTTQKLWSNGAPMVISQTRCVHCGKAVSPFNPSALADEQARLLMEMDR